MMPVLSSVFATVMIVGCQDSQPVSKLFPNIEKAMGLGNGPKSRRSGEQFSNSIGMQLVVLPPGQFEMGSPETEEKRSGDETQHTVRLTQPRLMGVYEVTCAQYLTVMGALPEGSPTDGEQPVTNITWEQAVTFCQKLSAMPREQSASRIYRLPTEAEWEFACRGGSTTAMAFGETLSSMQANFDGNCPYGTDVTGAFLGSPQPIGSYAANAFGLHDMHGNVWEYCSDWYAADAYIRSEAADPQGPATGASHVIRGGSWYNFGYACRSAYRSEYTPPLDANIYGFRVVASLGQDSFDPTTSTFASVINATDDTFDRVATALASQPDTSPDTSTVPVASSAGTNSSDALPDIRYQSIAAFVFAALTILTVLSLCDSSSLFSLRNADLALYGVIGIVSARWPQLDPVTNFLIMAIFAFGLTGRQIYGLIRGSLPKPLSVPARKPWVWLAVLIAAGFRYGIQIYPGAILATSTLIDCWSHLAIGIAIFCLVPKDSGHSFRGTLLILWMLVPTPAAEADPWLCLSAALIIWAFLFLDRPVVAGTILGLATVFGVYALLVLPVWSLYFLGKPRKRFTVAFAASAAIIVAASECVLSTGMLSQAGDLPIPSLFARWFPSGFSVGVLVILLLAVNASAFLLTRQSKPHLVALTGSLLTASVLMHPNMGAVFQAYPWILMSLLGLASQHSRVSVTPGIYPAATAQIRKSVSIAKAVVRWVFLRKRSRV